MKLIDTHAHLLKESYEDDLENVIKISQNNFREIWNIAWDYETSKEVIQLNKRFPFLRPVIGFHPNNVSEVSQQQFLNLESLINDDVIAIGEIGLDFYHDASPRDLQKVFFIKQLELARKKQLPVIIHTRESIDDTFNILKEYTDLKILVHSWSGSIVQTKLFLDTFPQIFFSFNGIITYKNAEEIRNTFKTIPLKNLLIETDCPWLAPTPLRGKKNQPNFIEHIYAFVAELLNITFEQLVEEHENNVNRFLTKKLN